MKYCKIDSEGYYIEDVITAKETDDKTLIDTEYKGGFFKPKWDGSKWIEGSAEEEIKEFKENNVIEESNNTLEKRVLDIEEALASMMGGM